MKIYKNETTTIVKNELNEVISTRKCSSYTIYPDECKLLKHKSNGFTTDSCIGVSSKSDIANYEEINKVEDDLWQLPH